MCFFLVFFRFFFLPKSDLYPRCICTQGLVWARMYEEQIKLKADRFESRSAEDSVSLAVLAPGIIVQELCESRGGRPGLFVLMNLLISVDVKLY